MDYLIILVYTGYLYGGIELFKKLKQWKVLIKFLFTLAFLIDFSLYWVGASKIRGTRILRALMMALHSKDLRRNLLGLISISYFLGIIKSIKNLVILFIFYFFIIGAWAFIGSNLFSDMQGVD